MVESPAYLTKSVTVRLLLNQSCFVLIEMTGGNEISIRRT